MQRPSITARLDFLERLVAAFWKKRGLATLFCVSTAATAFSRGMALLTETNSPG